MTEIAERDEIQNQLCARIEELEREKEELNKQLDRREVQMGTLRAQAEALHRTGSILNLDPGARLPSEVPDRVEALAALVEEAKPLIKAYRNQMGARWTLGGDKLEEADKTASWLTSAPYAPLARRDARMKAEALEEWMEAAPPEFDGIAYLEMKKRAEGYRRLAEEAGRDAANA